MVSSAYVIRHGETEWSRSGRHTGRTEIPLSGLGEQNARRLAASLAAVRFSLVLTSPRQRARRTCELAGLGEGARADPDLAEWDYGDYEGLTSAEILKARPGWVLFRDGCPGGESPGQVSARADRLIARILPAAGVVALFSHGHFGRVLAARWVGLPVGAGERLLLDTASLGILSFEHGIPAAPVIARWNIPPQGGAS
jgi:broad specificity phosphatase PhoE